MKHCTKCKQDMKLLFTSYYCDCEEKLTEHEAHVLAAEYRTNISFIDRLTSIWKKQNLGKQIGDDKYFDFAHTINKKTKDLASSLKCHRDDFTNLEIIYPKIHPSKANSKGIYVRFKAPDSNTYGYLYEL